MDRSRMAYLSPDFDYDVFVSYSHGDPEGVGESPLKTWSHALIETLKDDIKSLSDGEFDELAVWYDRDFDTTLHLTPELRGKVKTAAVLMILMSPRYLKSKWCGDERAWFQEQIEDRTADEGRVFIVRAGSTDEGAWPDFLRDERGHAIIGFRFHPPPRQPGDIVEPFGWPDLFERNEPFRRALETLRTALIRRLRELKKRFASRAIAPAVSTIPGRPPRIYLHARPEHAELRAEIVSALRKHECIVVHPPPPACSSNPVEWLKESKARIAAVHHCDALALLRPSADPTFVGDLLDVGVDERERVQAARRAPLPCAVLDHSGAPLEVDAARFDIEHFELGNPQWPAAFLAWIGRHRAASAADSR
jgi:TIR domain-containing protein